MFVNSSHRNKLYKYRKLSVFIISIAFYGSSFSSVFALNSSIDDKAYKSVNDNNSDYIMIDKFDYNFIDQIWRDMHLMLKADDEESFYDLLKNNPNATYAVIGNVIYAIENKTLKQLENWNGIEDLTKNLLANDRGQIYLTAAQKNEITSNTSHANKICQLWKELNEMLNKI